MIEVLSLQEEEYQATLSSEKANLFDIIKSQDQSIEELTSILNYYTSLKQTRTHRLYSYFKKQQNKRKLKEIFGEWSKFQKFKKRTRKMNTYVINFYKRGSLRKDFKFWKNEVQAIRREKTAKRNVEITKEEIFKSIGSICQESDTLRKMISEITEDLRNETIAKNMLKNKFEQALYRGISALNSESSNVAQEKFPAFASSQGFRG
jgi:hypothetical protein